jgi:hypothetical protein
MGQQEVYELLKNKRLSGDDRYFSIKDIRRMVLDSHSNTNSVETVARSLERLYNWGLLEKKLYTFRLRKSALEQSSL